MLMEGMLQTLVRLASFVLFSSYFANLEKNKREGKEKNKREGKEKNKKIKGGRNCSYENLWWGEKSSRLSIHSHHLHEKSKTN